MSNPLYLILIYPIIFILPAYVANGAPVIFGRGNPTPIDLNRKFRNRPIFGRHKTIRGLVGGIACGIFIGFIESQVPGFSFMFAVGILQSLGTHFGDLLGSFIKRQRGMKEGQKAELFDQYLFLIFALLFCLPIALPEFPVIYGIIFIFIFTWIMHRLTNIGAYLLKIKDVPW